MKDSGIKDGKRYEDGFKKKCKSNFFILYIRLEQNA